jgi:hypothetical protein
MRISEALALEARHFINGGLTILVEQQVNKDQPRIVNYLKTDASFRQIDLHPDVADYLRTFVVGKSELILHTKNGTPYLYGNLADDWLDEKLAKLGLYEAGMGWHSFKRFRNSWLRAPAQRCQEDLRHTSRRRWVNCIRRLKKTSQLGSTKSNVWAMVLCCPRKLF